MSKIIIKSKREIALMKEAGIIMIELFDYLESITKEGLTTQYLDKEAGNFIKSKGARPACLGYEGFPANICISLNDTLLHGIGSKKTVLKNGDIISYDVVIEKNGYMVDACRTFGVGEISKENQRLIDVTKECFFEAVKLVKPGIHLGDISHKIEEIAHSYGYSLTEDFGGHGIGKDMHEDPMIMNVGREGSGPILKEGMCLCIEPMVIVGKKDTKILGDGWTVKTVDHSMCAHYENTVVVTSDGYEIITLKREDNNG